MVGPLNRPTFYAFDFITNNRLLWGKDILKSYTIPDPLQYKIQRYEWMKSTYFNRKQKGYDKKQNLILSVGIIISFLAIIDGIRDLKKNNLLNWSHTYPLFQGHRNFAQVIENYYKFILLQKETNVLDESWYKQAEDFVDWIYSENFSIS